MRKLLTFAAVALAIAGTTTAAQAAEDANGNLGLTAAKNQAVDISSSAIFKNTAGSVVRNLELEVDNPVANAAVDEDGVTNLAFKNATPVSLVSAAIPDVQSVVNDTGGTSNFTSTVDIDAYTITATTGNSAETFTGATNDAAGVYTFTVS